MRRVLHAFGLALAFTTTFVGSPSGEPPRAEAAVSVLISVEEVVVSSSWVVVARAVEHTARWEHVAGSRRIVTYTKLAIEETVVGEPSTELVVRTLGGAVDRIGQQVSGEAALVTGERAMFFLGDGEGATVVMGMAQGHYPVIEEGSTSRLTASPDAGALLPRRGPALSAREELVGANLDAAKERVRKAAALVRRSQP